MKTFSLSRPYSAEKNSDATSSNYPGLIYLLHMDDLVSGSKSWSPRVGTSVLTTNQEMVKDANGAYVNSLAVQTPTGTMPNAITGKYLLNIVVGQPSASDHVPNFDFGDNSTGDAFDANGAIWFSTTQYVSAAAISFPAFGMPQCHAAMIDLVNSVSPSCFRIFAPQDQSGIVTGNSTVTTPPVNAARSTAIGNVASIGDMDQTGTTQRFVLGALFALNTKLSSFFLQAACSWMIANPGKLFPGLRGVT